MWGESLCGVYIENFLTNHLVKEFWKSVNICQSYCQTSRGLLFWDTVCIAQCIRYTPVHSYMYAQPVLSFRWNIDRNALSLLSLRLQMRGLCALPSVCLFACLSICLSVRLSLVFFPNAIWGLVNGVSRIVSDILVSPFRVQRRL